MSERTGRTLSVPVYLRSGPGIQHPAAATIPPETSFTVLQEVAPWLNILTDTGAEGYLHQNFAILDPFFDFAVSFAADANRTGKAPNFLNLRTGPGTNFDKIIVLAPETPLEILAQEGVWLKISAEGVQGYVHGDYVILDPAPSGAGPSLMPAGWRVPSAGRGPREILSPIPVRVSGVAAPELACAPLR